MSAMEDALPKESLSGWDRLGIWASVACTIHCLIAPLLFLLAPAFASVWAHPASHAIIALFVLPAAATVLRRGYKVHRKRWIAVTTTLGGALILVGCVLPYVGSGAAGHGSAEAAAACAECCPQLVESTDGDWSLNWPAASIVTVLGSVFLVASHMGNLVCTRRCCSKN